MLAGYVTFEIGSSVMQQADAPQAAREDCVLVGLSYPLNRDAASSPTNGKLVLHTTPNKCQSLQELASMRAAYHHDELVDYGILLIVTMLVSVLIA